MTTELVSFYKCYKCKELKPPSEFHKGNGLTPRNKVAAYCKICMSAYGKIYEQTEKSKQSRKRYRESVKLKPEVKLKQLLRVKHVDRSALDFEWCWNKLVAQDFKCEITKVPFIWEAKHPQTLSIDRIDPKQGYTKTNVRFVCWWLNVAMGDWGLDKLKELIKGLNGK